jgi:hypothetical protein
MAMTVNGTAAAMAVAVRQICTLWCFSKNKITNFVTLAVVISALAPEWLTS